jgi:chitinase
MIKTGSWNQRTGHNSPLYARSDQTDDNALLNQVNWFVAKKYIAIDFKRFSIWINKQATVDTWIELGAPADKLVLGLAMYGRTFTLKVKSMNGLNAPALEAGKNGQYTAAAGFLAYFEVCQALKDNGWTREWNEEQSIPYAYKDNQWVSYYFD